jgi:ankyrin repeat protein
LTPAGVTKDLVRALVGVVDRNALLILCGPRGSGDVGEVRDLIARGINIDEQNEYQRTALVLAAWFNHIELVKELVCAGVALDVQDKDGTTALMFAALQNHIEVMEELMSGGRRVCRVARAVRATGAGGDKSRNDVSGGRGATRGRESRNTTDGDVSCVCSVPFTGAHYFFHILVRRPGLLSFPLSLSISFPVSLSPSLPLGSKEAERI